MLEKVQATIRQFLSNPLVLLALSALGVTQIVFWGYLSILPRPLVHLIDVTFVADFYRDILGRAILAFAALHMGLAPLLVLLHAVPLSLFRYSRVRLTFRVIQKHQFTARLFFFPFSIFAVFFSGFYLSVIVALLGAVAGLLIVLAYVNLWVARPDRENSIALKKLEQELKDATPAELADPLFQEKVNSVLMDIRKAAKKRTRVLRLWGKSVYSFRAITIPTLIIAGSYFLGVIHAVNKLTNDTYVRLPNLEKEALIIGRTREHLILLDKGDGSVIAVTMNSNDFISIPAKWQASD